MGIVHVVMFQFEPLATPEEIQSVSQPAHRAAATAGRLTRAQVCMHMLALKENCIHPDTGKPYVQKAMGGTDNSPEGRQARSSPACNL